VATTLNEPSEERHQNQVRVMATIAFAIGAASIVGGLFYMFSGWGPFVGFAAMVLGVFVCGLGLMSRTLTALDIGFGDFKAGLKGR